MENIISDATGRNRIALHFVPQGGGANFHSLVWSVYDGASWAEHIVITHEAFQAPTKYRRWIASLHSFDPEAGRAILLVAEGDAPEGSPSIHCTYSWRDWDLLRNREVAVLAVCNHPFEKYEPKA
jgi:hypothetical protein